MSEKRNLRTAIYGDYVVFQKGEESDFPVAVLLDLSEAETCCSLSKNRYIMKRENGGLLEFGSVVEI